MRPHQTGTIVARGIGLVLILLGICGAVGNSEFFLPQATSGWTSYSPLATNNSPPTVWHDTYFAVATLWLPCLVQILLGSALILFSKAVGRWLALGLNESDDRS